MALGTDFSLGPFAVDAAGRLRPRQPDVPPRFTVRWRGQTICARLREGLLALETTLGRVPSTAASATGSPPRERAFAALRALAASLPSSWRLRLAPDHRVRIEAEQVLQTPPTAVGLVAEVTGFLLLLDPVLTELDSAGLARGSAADGMR